MTTKKNTVLDSCVNATKRMAKDKGVDINFYDNEWAKYFAAFVRRVYGKKNLNDEECIALLNDDFIRNVQGGLLKNSNKERNLSHAYLIYKNAVASVETALAKEYGEQNYYDLEKSKNEQARDAFVKFETWQDKKDKEFEQLANVSDAIYKIQHSKNPMKELSQNSLVLTPPKEGLRGDPSAAFLILFIPSFFVTVSVLLFALSCTNLKNNVAYTRELDDFAAYYGFDDRAGLFDYINKTTYQYLTPDEANLVYDYMVNEVKENLALEYGFNNLEEALLAIQNSSTTQEATAMYIVQKLTGEHQEALEMFAQQNGFENYQSMQAYIAEHYNEDYNFLLHHTDRYYDFPLVGILAKQCENINKYYDDKIAEVSEQRLDTIDVINDTKLAELSTKLNSAEAIVNASYGDLITDKANIFYSQDEMTQILAYNVLGIANKYGYDTITDNILEEIVIGEKANSYENKISNATQETSHLLEQTIDFDTFGTLGGVGIGVCMSVAARNNKLFRQIIQMHKLKKLQTSDTEITAQIEKDLQR